jgi:SAM-dependent methyltransferase
VASLNGEELMVDEGITPRSADEDFRDYTQKRSAHWDHIASAPPSSLGGYYQRRLAEVYALLIPEGSKVLEVGCARGDLLAALNPHTGVGIDFSEDMVKSARCEHPKLRFEVMDAHNIDLEIETYDFIVLSDGVNDFWDIQTAIGQLRPYCGAHTRVIFNFFSHLWQSPLSFARAFGMATPTLRPNWLTPVDLHNLLTLCGFEALRHWQEFVVPLPLPGARWLNRIFPKLVPFHTFALTHFIVTRPVAQVSKKQETCSVVIAARNEEGHIDELMKRVPDMGGKTEIIFVEGNSTDDTYGAIERAIAKNPERKCKLFKQAGKGKGDAVRTGFREATGDILMILDADITVIPEDLPRFYDAIHKGQGEFINGVRLVYPMEDEAMRFFNKLGNKFFAAAFSFLLGQPIRDTLCGTKVIRRTDYERLAANRAYFGDFDPFGDFDLLFGAAKLNLKILEVPVRYRARRYGETNIQRWRHGLLLLRMVVFAARRIKFV